MGRAMLAYVFEVSHLEFISATIDAGNEQSKRVVRKIGMAQRPFPDDEVSYWTIDRPED